MRKMLRTKMFSGNDIVDLSHCCLSHTFRSFCQVCKVKIWGCNLDLEVSQRLKNVLVGCPNIDLFTVAPSKTGILYAAMHVL